MSFVIFITNGRSVSACKYALWFCQIVNWLALYVEIE